MNLLLDTCSFLWALEEPEHLSDRAYRAVGDAGNSLFLSAVSVWEIVLKHGLGHLRLADALEVTIPLAMRDLKLSALDLDVDSAMLGASLPAHHKDPFDRMLVCQALHHGLTILTPDRLIQQYEVPCLW